MVHWRYGLAGRQVRINGTKIFVDDRGDPDAPALLYIHGGPGQGCYDFMRSQGDRLAARLRVVGVDQRGTLRSDPLPATPPLTADLLISDFETIRIRLRIDSWALLGHSAGAGYGLRYVTSQPGAIRSVIFDCPCWDADMSDRYRLPVVARLLEEMRQLADAERCRELAAKAGRLSFSDGTRQAMQTLGSRYMEHFFHDPVGAAVYEPVLGLLPRVRRPALLMRGQDDLVTAPRMVSAFAEAVPDGQIRVFGESGHFAYLEEPDAYCEAVTQFVLAHAA
jgi:proline iminopeptidase